MNLFELFVKIGVDDQASSKIPKIASGLQNTLSTAAKAGTAAVAAASAGIVALTKNAVNQYADYEQLVGGVDTLFKESSETVQQYAEEAFETAGLSANDYMATVTSFSASLLQSLGNDTAQAAEYAQQAIVDMSDNANKMGTDMALIQNAYQGFAKANYTMLDNLKLGYGGTQAEMKRLIEDAARLSDTVDAQSMSFANVVQAIHVVQTEMGITGTTAKEASSTIAGSAAAMKAAWNNLVVAMADDTADFEGAFDNMLESVGTFGKNILPRVEVALGGVGKLVEAAAGELPGFIDKAVDGISEKLPDLLNTGGKIVSTVFDAITTNAPTLLSTGVTILSNFADGVESALSTDGSIGRATAGIIDTAVSFLTNENGDLTKFLGAAGKIVTSLGGYLIDTATNIKAGADEIISKAVEYLSDEENRQKLKQKAGEIVTTVSDGIKEFSSNVKEGATEIANKVVAYINDPETQLKWDEVGKNIASSVAAALGKYSYMVEEKIADWVDKEVQRAEDARKRLADAFSKESISEGLHDWVDAGEALMETGDARDAVAELFGEDSLIIKWSDATRDFVENFTDSFNEGYEQQKMVSNQHWNTSTLPVEPGVALEGPTPLDGVGGTVNNTFNIYTQAKTEADLAEEIVYAQERAVLTGTQQVLAP